jgi:hypothetical protein
LKQYYLAIEYDMNENCHLRFSPVTENTSVDNPGPFASAIVKRVNADRKQPVFIHMHSVTYKGGVFALNFAVIMNNLIRQDVLPEIRLCICFIIT